MLRRAGMQSSSEGRGQGEAQEDPVLDLEQGECIQEAPWRKDLIPTGEMGTPVRGSFCHRLFCNPHTPRGQSPTPAHQSGYTHLSGSFQKTEMFIEPSVDRVSLREIALEG